MLNKGIYFLGGKELEGVRFYADTQNGARFKTYKLFISRIFHLLCLDYDWPWVTETTENETARADQLKKTVINIYYLSQFLWGKNLGAVLPGSDSASPEVQGRGL